MAASATGKRYAELPGVDIRAENIPSSIRPLLEVAKAWAIVGDSALEREIRKVGKAAIRSAVEQASPLKDQIHHFALQSKGSKATPVPDEVVVFQIFLTSLHRLRSEVL